MKAVECKRYGTPENLEIIDVEKPVPGANEVLVRVHAASITYSNLILIRGKPFIARMMGLGLMRPKFRILGSDVAGVIESVGADVSSLKPGDEVFGDLSNASRGSFAEFVCAPENALALKPANADFVQAAALPEASLVALQALRDHGKIRAGMEVLIYGASGGIGSYAVQLARYFGAHVTAVCGPSNLEVVKSLGADQVIDYTKDDFVSSGARYDLIVSTAGYRHIRDYKKALNPEGIYVSTGGHMKQIFQAMLLGPLYSEKKGRKLGSMLVKINEGLDTIRTLYEEGHLKTLVHKVYSLDQAVEAFTEYSKGHTRGKMVFAIK